MNPTNTTNLPSRLRESSFKRYEQTIQAAVASFPSVVIVIEDDFNGSLATFTSRFRDAMASLVMYRWTSEQIDMDKFDEFYPKIKVSHVMPDRVVIGSAENIKSYYAAQNINTNLPPSQFECFTTLPAQASVVDPKLVSSATTSSIIAVSLSQDIHDKGVELKFLAGLAALRVLNSAVEINIDSEQAKYLEDNFDVVLTKVNDNTYTMQ